MQYAKKTPGRLASRLLDRRGPGSCGGERDRTGRADPALSGALLPRDDRTPTRPVVGHEGASRDEDSVHRIGHAGLQVTGSRSRRDRAEVKGHREEQSRRGLGPLSIWEEEPGLGHGSEDPWTVHPDP